MNDFTEQLNADLTHANTRALREARALQSSMERLISRLEAGGQVVPMDSLGSRSSQFDSAIGEASALARVVNLAKMQQEGK